MRILLYMGCKESPALTVSVVEVLAPEYWSEIRHELKLVLSHGLKSFFYRFLFEKVADCVLFYRLFRNGFIHFVGKLYLICRST